MYTPACDRSLSSAFSRPRLSFSNEDLIIASSTDQLDFLTIRCHCTILTFFFFVGSIIDTHRLTKRQLFSFRLDCSFLYRCSWKHVSISFVCGHHGIKTAVDVAAQAAPPYFPTSYVAYQRSSRRNRPVTFLRLGHRGLPASSPLLLPRQSCIQRERR